MGMGAIVLNGAHIGQGCIVAAGTVVLESTAIPPNSLVAGIPGKVHRETTADERVSTRSNAHAYVELAARHALAGDYRCGGLTRHRAECLVPGLMESVKPERTTANGCTTEIP